MKKFIIYTDGASRGNPGHSAAGIVIKTEDGVIWVQDGKYLGTATNNVAEYSAVIFALERLISDFSNILPASVEFIVDSMLIANQLSGNFKIKNETLKELFLKVKQLEQKVGLVTYTYTPRANNVLADKMANQAIDNHLMYE
jgi:ribonuclease HI